MVLDELHVLERRARPIGERHPVAVLDVRVGRKREDLAAATSAQDHGLRRNAVDLSGDQLDGNDAQAAPVIDKQLGDEPLVESLDSVVLQRRLEQRVEHVETGLVRGEPRPLRLHPAERADSDTTIRVSAPGTPPVFQLHHFTWRFFDKRLDHILIAQPICPRHGVVGMGLGAISGLDDSRGAAFGRNRMASHRIHLGHDSDLQIRPRFRRRDTCAQTGPATTNDEYVTRVSSHCCFVESPQTRAQRSDRIVEAFTPHQGETESKPLHSRSGLRPLIGFDTLDLPDARSRGPRRRDRPMGAGLVSR